MKWLDAWSLRAKLRLSLGGLFFILLVGSAVSAIVLSHFSHELQRLLQENYNSEVFCSEMIDALDRLDASSRQLAWNEGGDPVDANAQIKRFDENLIRQLNNTTLPGEHARSHWLAQQWGAYRLSYDRLSRLAPAERQQLYTQSLLPGYRDTRACAKEIATLNMDNVVSADGRVRATLVEVRNALLVLIGVAAVLAIAVLGAIGTTVLEPLRDLIKSARRIGSGDLDLNVSIRTQDEVGQLGEAFNAMAERLREYRKIDHDRLLRAQRTTQLAIDSLPDAVIVLSLDGTIEISNRTAATHFAAEPGKKVSELKLDWLADLFDRVVHGMAMADPRGYSSAVQLFDDGHERFMLPRGVHMLNPAGQVVGVTIILADVTNLRRADEFKSGLVSTVSHELRTPLTTIRMSTLLLADETLGPLTPKQRKLVDAAKDESERLYRIIEGLLEFSRAQAAAGKPTATPIAVKKIVAGALAPLATGFSEKGIHLTIAVSDDSEVMADASGAISVLSNLLSNALKFTPAGGAVTVASRVYGEQISLSVSDSGPGIPPEYAEKIFDRFFRIPGRDTAPGSGLGLAIARQLIEAQGGTLTFAPGPGGGSIFTFTLPAPAMVEEPLVSDRATLV